MKTLLSKKSKWLSGTCLMTCLFFLVFHVAWADNKINNGTTLTINAGMTVLEYGSSTVIAGGVIDNHGTMIIKGNLVNGNTSTSDLGTGTFEFSGATPQTISGPNIFGSLKINNSTGVSLTGSYDNRVNGILTLTSGLLTIGSLNLIMGPAATIAATPTPTASNMVVVDGTGELRKEFAGISSFTYPVGDNTGTAEYSPVTLNFTSGSFGSGNYAGLKLVNAKYPDDSITGSYLNRYWTVTQTGIIGFNCNATFKYNYPTDVTGTESQLYCVRVDPWTTFDPANTTLHQLTASGLTSFSTFTATRGQMLVNLTAFLEGPYDPGTKTMTTLLNAGGLIPMTQQPYNGSPWNYSPAQSVPSIPANVVDWILIELRQGTSAGSATYLTRKAAFLKSDGSIVNTDGSSPVRFNNVALSSGMGLYPVIRHRNHMAILSSSAALQNTDGSFTFNFSTGDDKVFGGAAGYVQLETSPARWGMPGGDANADNFIYGNDYTDYWVPTSGSEGVYEPGDFNMDGNIYGNDYTEIWIKNSGMENPLP